jgi:hypothetical protein
MGAPLYKAWATTDDVCAPCTEVDVDADVLTAALLVASEILNSLTGGVYAGLTSDVVRPTRPPHRLSGASVVRLPRYPVVSVDRVTVDGADLDPARYTVFNHRFLALLTETDGRRTTLPRTQRLDLPVTERGTWEVEFTHGRTPPPGGVRAAATYGCQLALACTPATAGLCKLPQRVTTITRQGVSLALIQEGGTGLPEVDLWVVTDRLARARRGAQVVIPDLCHPYTVARDTQG